MLRSLAFGALSFSIVAQAPAQVRVEGRVLDAGGRPIADAVVALVPTASGNRDLGTIPLARTSAKGTFALVAPPSRIGLTLTAPGFLPHFRNLELKAGETPVAQEIRLERGGHRIQGTVVPAKGMRLEGVRLAFSKFSQDEGDQFFAEVKQGQFDITLAPGGYLVGAHAKGQAGGQRLEVKGDQAGLKVELQAEPTPAKPVVLDWIKAKAIPLKAVEAGKGFADMQPLKALVGNAKIVALGEATHGTREFFRLKHRMLEFLATEMGFTVFGIEANLPEAFAVDDYIRTGQGDPAKALAGLYFWTWNTEEVLDMIRWMRAYNEDPAHTNKLRFYGFDMQTETVAYEQAKGWLDKAHPEEASKLVGLRERMAKLPDPRRAKATEEDRKAWTALAQELESLIGRLEAVKAELAKADGGEVFDRQRQNLRVLAQFAALEADASGGSKVRDESMAANVRWIQEREKGARMVLWAHNGHISFMPGAIGGEAGMGSHLRRAMGANYLPIGFAFREGGFQAVNTDPKERGLKNFEVKPEAGGTLDAALAAPGRPVLALDLRALPKQGPVKSWFDSPQGTWSIGAMFGSSNPSVFIAKEPITRAYDALLFVNRTTAAVPVGKKKSGGGAPVTVELAKAPANLGFEEGIQSWFLPKVPGYSAAVIGEKPKDGGRCLQVVFEGEPRADAWYSVMQAVDATPYRGKKVRLSGWVRTDGRKGFLSGLWMRVDRKSGMGFFDNMMNRPITATEWTEAVIEGQVEEDAQVFNLGCLAIGMGTAWYDTIQIEILP
jgi:erythromycin esterase